MSNKITSGLLPKETSQSQSLTILLWLQNTVTVEYLSPLHTSLSLTRYSEAVDSEFRVDICFLDTICTVVYKYTIVCYPYCKHLKDKFGQGYDDFC